MKNNTEILMYSKLSSGVMGKFILSSMVSIQCFGKCSTTSFDCGLIKATPPTPGAYICNCAGSCELEWIQHFDGDILSSDPIFTDPVVF